MTGNALRRTLFSLSLMLAACGGSGGGSGGEGGGGGESKPLPSIQLTTPIDGATVTGSRSITVTGTGANVDAVEVKLNGVAVPATDVSATATGFTAKVTLGDNANTIQAVATNANGTASSGVVTVTYPFARFTTFQPAAVVVGQADFSHRLTGTVSATTLNTPSGNPLVHGGKLYVGDSNQGRVLVFDPVPTTNGASASLALGQPDLVTANVGTTAGGLSWPTAVVADESGRLLVADSDSNRVLILNGPPTASGVAADVVVGQADLTSNAPACTRTGLRIGLDLVNVPGGLSVAGGKLVVADSGNHRVLVWNGIPTTSGAPADLVLGQADFDHCLANAGSTTGIAGGFDGPSGVWSDGTRLVVVDGNNNRILIWNTFPTVNGEPADLVLGQVDLTVRGSGSGQGTLRRPRAVSSNGNQLVVTDTNNNRVLIWNTFPGSSAALADVVLGQRDFGPSQHNDDNLDGIPEDDPTARTLYRPSGVALHGNQLLVSDSANHRLLIYDAQ